MRVQIAFQGGGARLSDLLHAAEVLQEEERLGHIEITRVAGTSAGAIAATVVACGEGSAKAVNAYLKTHGKRLVSLISGTPSGEVKLATISKALAAWNGKPLLRPNGLREVLTEVLQHAIGAAIDVANAKAGTNNNKKPGLKISEICDWSKKDLQIIAADLVHQQPVIFPKEGDDLIAALVDSAALPFAFRGYRELAANCRVDGGLCNNLPSDQLLAGAQQFGQVLAISFDDKGDGRAPDSLGTYIQSLVSTAISGGVARSKTRLDEDAVLSLTTSLSTFDFAKGFVDVSPDHSASIAAETLAWIDKVRRRPLPLQNAEAVFEQSMRDVFKWYKASQEREKRRSIKCVLVATAICCKARTVDKADADWVSKEYHFVPLEGPMTMFHVLVGKSPLSTGIEIDVIAPDGHRISHRAIPALDGRHNGGSIDNRDFGFVLLFDVPLQPLTEKELNEGLSYRVRTRYEQRGALTGLLPPARHDSVIYGNLRAEAYEAVEVIVCKPKIVALRSVAEWTEQSQKGWAEAIAPSAIQHYCMDPSMDAMGWRVGPFPNGRVLRIDLHTDS